MESAVLNIRIQPELKNAFKWLAEKEGCSLSALVERLITEQLDATENNKNRDSNEAQFKMPK